VVKAAQAFLAHLSRFFVLVGDPLKTNTIEVAEAPGWGASNVDGTRALHGRIGVRVTGGRLVVVVA
jgi:hypothetical protein